MKKTTTIDKNFKGLTVINGRHYYSGDLVVDGNVVIDGDLVVAGNLTSHGLVANNIAVEGNATVNGDLEAGRFCIYGDLVVAGDTKAKRGISQVYGRLTTNNLVIDRLYAGGDRDIRGKIYVPLQGGLFK